MTNYGKAVRKSGYWFGDGAYHGSKITPNTGVIHTTEGTSLPTYEGGATAPTYTAMPNFRTNTLDFYAHFPDEQSARALRNESGGVETNTLNCIQIELVGTCDEATSRRWGSVPHIYWGNAPDWALRSVAEFVADMNKRHKIPISGPNKRWAKYPDGYGSSASQRFTFREWTAFYGWCGHQHVPENLHGDPGNINWPAIEKYAKEIVTPQKKETRVETAKSLLANTVKVLDLALKDAENPRLRVVAARKAAQAALKALSPKEKK